MLTTLLVLLACSPAPSPQMVGARAYLAGEVPVGPRFPAGEPVDAELRAWLESELGQPDHGAVALELLIAQHIAADPMAVRGANVIRQPSMVAVLVRKASAPEPVRTIALLALLRNVPRALLRERGGALEGSLLPTDRLSIRVLAKAGVRARPNDPASPEGLALLAAGGDVRAEEELITRWRNATTGEARQAGIDALGWAATDRTLAALASDLRSPLLRPWKKGVRSIRLDVVEALHPHWPEELAFFPNQIASGKDLLRAEQVVKRRLDAVFEGAHAPFFTMGASAPEGLFLEHPEP